MNLQNYNENSIKTLAPREAVRENYAMYVGDNTSRGFHHLLTEIVANAMDEAASGFGTLIRVEIDTKKNQASVIDKGRGIPFRLNSEGKYAIKEMCTSLHSGGKFASAGNYKSSLGLHGLGATVTNALSKMFRIEVARADGDCVLEFRDGEETAFSIEDKANKITGSTVTFIPDPEVFEGTKWDKETIMEELQLHALLNNNLTFILIWDGKEVAKYLYTNGIRDMLNLKFGDAKPLTDIITYKTIVNKDTASECSVELALRYSTEGTEKVYAFTNGGYNPDLGTHVTGFRSAWTSKINQLAREHELLKMNDENLEGTIIRRGLCLVLSIKMTERPMFAEQTKLKLTSPGARGYVSQAVGGMTLPKKDMEAIVNKILLEKKAEEAAQRKRDAIKAISAGGKNINVLKEVSEKFSDATSKTGDRELFVVEGRSAAGSAKEARDSKIQAIYPLRGKPLNTLTKEIEDIVKNQEIKDILAILGCGIGEKFNLKNLRYDKIIILSDADVDGSHINILLVSLFIAHLPELLMEGKVYCATPPLFKVSKGKQHYWLYEPEELKNYPGWEAIRFKGLGEMRPIELWESTMDPATRHLVQLLPSNLEETSALFKTLMGNSSLERKKFIMANALKYRLMDEDIYDVDEGDE